MTYREAIKESLDKIKINTFAGNSENPDTYVETIPCCYPYYDQVTSGITALYCRDMLGIRTMDHFIELTAGTKLNLSEEMCRFRWTMHEFYDWLLDEEIPDKDADAAWYTPEVLLMKYSEFNKIQNDDNEQNGGNQA